MSHKGSASSDIDLLNIRASSCQVTHCVSSVFLLYTLTFLDAIASPSSYPCQSVSEWVSQWLIVSGVMLSHLQALRVSFISCNCTQHNISFYRAISWSPGISFAVHKRCFHAMLGTMSVKGIFELKKKKNNFWCSNHWVRLWVGEVRGQTIETPHVPRSPLEAVPLIWKLINL